MDGIYWKALLNKLIPWVFKDQSRSEIRSDTNRGNCLHYYVLLGEICSLCHGVENPNCEISLRRLLKRYTEKKCF